MHKHKPLSNNQVLLPKMIYAGLMNSMYFLSERVKLSFVNPGQDSYLFTRLYADYNLWAVTEWPPHRELEPVTYNFSGSSVVAHGVRTLRAGYQDTSVASELVQLPKVFTLLSHTGKPGSLHIKNVQSNLGLQTTTRWTALKTEVPCLQTNKYRNAACGHMPANFPGKLLWLNPRPPSCPTRSVLEFL